MATYAIVDNDVVTDVCYADPTKLYHPDVAKHFVTVPDEVKTAWKKTGDNTFEAPPAREYTPPTVPGSTGGKISPGDQRVCKTEFMLAMTKDERKVWRTKIGNDDLVDTLEEEWTLGDIWLATNIADNEFKDTLADLKTKGLIGDATIKKLKDKYFLDNPNYG